jgi:hypothetical protein
VAPVGAVNGHVERLRRLLPALWLGALLCVALVATPSVFAVLPAPQAGPVVGRILAQEAWLSLTMSIVLLVIERTRARAVAVGGSGSQLSPEILLVAGAAFCTLAGYFGIQPMMPASRLGEGPFSFGQLHLASTTLFGIKAVLVALLAWRASAPGVIPRTSS